MTYDSIQNEVLSFTWSWHYLEASIRRIQPSLFTFLQPRQVSPL